MFVFENHLRERIVHAGGEVFVLGTMCDPDGVEMNVVGEGAEEGKNVDDLGGVGRQVGLVDGGGQLRRRREVESQRDVLGEVEAAVGQGVLADVGAESVAAGAGLGGGCERGVDLFADLLAHGGGGGEIGVVAAGVQRYGDIEERLAGLERDGGAAGLGLRDARRRVSVMSVEAVVGVAAADRGTRGTRLLCLRGDSPGTARTEARRRGTRKKAWVLAGQRLSWKRHDRDSTLP